MADPCIYVKAINFAFGFVLDVDSFNEPLRFSSSVVVPQSDLIKIAQLFPIVKGEDI